jgi:hypothetical protein
MRKGGFSWRRYVGISGAKARMSRKIGIPLSRSGRQQKIGRIVTGGGCALPAVLLAATAALVAAGARARAGARSS